MHSFFFISLFFLLLNSFVEMNEEEKKIVKYTQKILFCSASCFPNNFAKVPDANETRTNKFVESMHITFDCIVSICNCIHYVLVSNEFHHLKNRLSLFINFKILFLAFFLNVQQHAVNASCQFRYKFILNNFE